MNKQYKIFCIAILGLILIFTSTIYCSNISRNDEENYIEQNNLRECIICRYEKDAQEFSLTQCCNQYICKTCINNIALHTRRLTPVQCPFCRQNIIVEHQSILGQQRPRRRVILELTLELSSITGNRERRSYGIHQDNINFRSTAENNTNERRAELHNAISSQIEQLVTRATSINPEPGFIELITTSIINRITNPDNDTSESQSDNNESSN